MNELVKYEAKYEDYLNPEIPERRFKLVYANKECFYLTEEERNFMLNQLNNGTKYIQIGEHTFTGGFIALYPIRERKKPVEYELVEIDGKQVYREL